MEKREIGALTQRVNVLVSGAVHTRVEVHRMDLEMSRLVE